MYMPVARKPNRETLLAYFYQASLYIEIDAFKAPFTPYRITFHTGLIFTPK
jgi:hypothetical protein